MEQMMEKLGQDLEELRLDFHTMKVTEFKLSMGVTRELEELCLDFNTMKTTTLNSSPRFEHSEGASSPTIHLG
jgi:hypothetical protein